MVILVLKYVIRGEGNNIIIFVKCNSVSGGFVWVVFNFLWGYFFVRVSML